MSMAAADITSFSLSEKQHKKRQKIDKNFETMLEVLNSGTATRLPLVQSAFDSAARIFQLSQKVRSNQNKFVELAEESCRLVYGIYVKSTDEQEIEQSLKHKLRSSWRRCNRFKRLERSVPPGALSRQCYCMDSTSRSSKHSGGNWNGVFNCLNSNLQLTFERKRISSWSSTEHLVVSAPQGRNRTQYREQKVIWKGFELRRSEWQSQRQQQQLR